MTNNKTVTIRVNKSERDFLNQIRGKCILAGAPISHPEIVRYLFSLVKVVSEEDIVNRLLEARKVIKEQDETNSSD